jgi:4-amino-4-deoxy-L-arabinose transferase-like glycosyltransferase
MIGRLTPVLSGIIRRFNRWRVAFLLFLLLDVALLLLYLDYAPLRWDETPHLVGGLLLRRGQLQGYAQEYLFYPPLLDLATALYYLIIGSSVFSARLVALTFGILSIWTVFEYTYRLYGPRNALLSSILLASMPGFIILCRLALIETMLIFFFSISLFLFFLGMQTNNNKMLVLSGITLGLGFLVKYQALIGGIIMLVSILFAGRQHFKTRLTKYLLILIIAGAVVAPWIFFTYQRYASDMLGNWLYVLGVGNEERLAYSTRFPTPVFYLIEMINPYWYIHPIYFPIFILALFGLGLWLWRRHEKDKFSLIIFFIVYFVFTLITSKDWRYITLVFPILAIAASDFIIFLWDKARENIRAPHINFRTKRTTKVATAVLVLLVSVSLIYSSWEAYLWVKRDQMYIPVREATQYVADNSALNEPAVALFTSNLFSLDMMRFYLETYGGQRALLQYPAKPIDVYQQIPDNQRVFVLALNILINRFEALNVKYLLLYEYENNLYFHSKWKSADVLELMHETGHFSLETEFGSSPRRIFVIRFLSSSQI